MKDIYLGLRSYSEDEADQFKGRDQESKELFHHILRNDYTVCYAESGEGKTSLMNAGVFPLLRQNMFFPIEVKFTKDDYDTMPDNFDVIIDRCINDSITAFNQNHKEFPVEYKDCSKDFDLIKQEETIKSSLQKRSWWKLRNFRPCAMGLVFTPVFIFDQFEEVFNRPFSVEWTNNFFHWLEELSSDSCPPAIIKEIRNFIGYEAAFPSINENKNFKAVFLLRSEFIGELDYWCMQNSFIPWMKDSRFCLKPLTLRGAKEVICLQDVLSLHTDSILSMLLNGRVIDTPDTPCVSALMLSIVCDSLNKSIKSKKEFNINEYISDANRLNTILNEFYEKTLEECEVSESDREIIEQVLVNSKGNRERVNVEHEKLEAISFSTKYLKVLDEKRLIKVLPMYNGKETYIELVHDCLAPVVSEHKKIRLEKHLSEARRTKRSNQFISLLFMNGMMVLGEESFFNDILFSFDSLEVCIFFLNFIITPFLLVGTVKSLISNRVVLSFLFFLSLSSIIINFWIVFISSVLPIIYAYMIFHETKEYPPLKQAIYSIWNIYITKLFYFTFIVVLYYRLFFSDHYYYHPSIVDSCWGVVLIPLYYIYLLILWFETKPKNKYMYLLIGLLCLLTVNAITGFILNKGMLILTLTLIAISIWLLYSTLELNKRYFASLSTYFIIIATFIINLGYWPVFGADYSHVKRVKPWNYVDVVNNGKYGRLNYRGDTLVPVLFNNLVVDSFKNKHIDEDYKYEAFVIDSFIVNKDKYLDDLIYPIRFVNNKAYYITSVSSFNVDKSLYDTCRNDISSLTTASAKFRLYSTRLYVEMRDAFFRHMEYGGNVNMQDLKNMSFVDSLLLIDTFADIDVLSNKRGDLNQDQLSTFTKNLTRSFYLCLLKESLANFSNSEKLSLFTRFYPHLMDINREFVINEELRFNNELKITLGKDTLSNTIRNKYSISGIYSNVVYDWINCFWGLCWSDICVHALSYQKSVDQEINNSNNNNSSMKDYIGCNTSRSKEVETVKLPRDSVNQMRFEVFPNSIDSHHNEFKTKELSLQLLTSSFIPILCDVLIENPDCIYRDIYIRVIESLYSLGFFRGFDMSLYDEKIESISTIIKNNLIEIERNNNVVQMNNIILDHIKKNPPISNE